MASSGYDVTKARAQFPALTQSQVFLDNAGGTQVLGTVVGDGRIVKYLSGSNVQLGATYKTSVLSTQRYYDGVKTGARYVNAKPEEIVLGPSTTQLYRNLSVALRPHFPPGSEMVISAVDHEANIASWVTLAEDLGITLKWWKPTTPSTKNPQLSPESLKPLLSSKTRLVTCTHASNLLGSITPVRAIADLVHSTCPDGLLCVDGVAYAPHRPIDMKALGVDMYAFSWYKVYGPHIAQLYVSETAQKKAMRSLGHYFKKGADLEEKLGLAGASYELAASLPAVTKYLEDQGWESMIKHEVELQEILLSWLRSKPDKITIYGIPESTSDKRVSVISFNVQGRSPKDFVEKVEAKSDFGFRWGHFYSKRLNDDILGLDDEGAIRVSMVHYNTAEEIRELVKALDAELAAS